MVFSRRAHWSPNDFPLRLRCRAAIYSPRLGIVVASVLLATIAYYFVVGWATSSEPAPGPQTASSERLPPIETSQPDVAMLQPGEPGAQVPSATKASRMLDPQEIKKLMKQGEQFIAAGNVVAARIVISTSCGGRRCQRCNSIGCYVRSHCACQARCGGTGLERGESKNLVSKGREPWLNGSNTAAGYPCKPLVWRRRAGLPMVSLPEISVRLHHRSSAHPSDRELRDLRNVEVRSMR